MHTITHSTLATFIFFISLSTLLGSNVEASIPNSSRLYCKSDSIPLLWMAVIDSDLTSMTPSVALQSSDLDEISVLCASYRDGKIVYLSIVHGDDSDLDQNMSLSQFIQSGLQIYRSKFPYGKVKVTDIQCENCDLAAGDLKLKVKTLKSLNLVTPSSSSMHTYSLRVFGKEVFHNGRSVSAILFEKASTGVNRVRFAVKGSDTQLNPKDKNLWFDYTE